MSSTASSRSSPPATRGRGCSSGRCAIGWTGVYGQQQVWSHLSARLGPRDARRALSCFEHLLTLLTSCPRHPICRRPGCCCQIGVDEAALAGLIAHAAAGDTAQAEAAAECFVRAGAVELAETAAPLGRLLAQAGAPPQPQHGPFTPAPAPMPAGEKRTLH